jgi:small subunit ribosomal protein S16
MQRAGSRNHPTYRVVVADSRTRRDGRFIEKVGFYNPCATPVLLQIDAERVKHWVERGAQPSESVRALLKHQRAGTVGTLSSAVAETE